MFDGERLFVSTEGLIAAVDPTAGTIATGALIDGAVGALSRRRIAEPDAIAAAALAPDGNRLAVGLTSSKVLVVDPLVGRRLRRLVLPAGGRCRREYQRALPVDARSPRSRRSRREQTDARRDDSAKEDRRMCGVSVC